MHDSQQPIRSIGVIGGGSAGYISALYLKQLLPGAEVSLIESSRIPVIGVGEATTPLLLDFLHRRLGFSMQEFFREARPTFKLGIRFVWGKAGQHHFNSTFGKADLCNAIYHSGDFNNLSFPSMLMERGKAPFLAARDAVVPVNPGRAYAYHIDNKHFLAYLKRKLLESGCRYIDAEIAEAAPTPAGSGIQALTARDGRTFRFELFIDCSGFRSLLLEKTLGSRWVDYSSSLATNRAVLGMRSNGGDPEPYTTAQTLKHGWLWNTPMQGEDHLGYVFSSEHCSDDEALRELKGHCSTVNGERVISFRPGRHAESWKGNVVAVGNSFAFIEPLQSTGLHMILFQLRDLGKLLKRNATAPQDVEYYNEITNKAWDRLRWFVAMHFKFNHRLDTPFWERCWAETDLSGLEEYLDYYLPNGPLGYDPEHPANESLVGDDIFPVYAHDAILTGCGVNDQFFTRRSARVTDDWPQHFGRQQLLAGECISHRAALAHVDQNGCEFRPPDFASS